MLHVKHFMNTQFAQLAKGLELAELYAEFPTGLCMAGRNSKCWPKKIDILWV